MSVFLGDGLRGFAQAADLPVGDAPFRIAGADFDNEGAPDRVSADRRDFYQGETVLRFPPS